MNIIGLCGRTAAGKSSVIAIVRNCFPKVKIISTGDATRDLLRKRGLMINHNNLQAITKSILDERGADYISFVFDLITKQSSMVVIDAFRRIEDISCVTKQYGQPIVLAVIAPEAIRFKRLLARGKESDPETENDFMHLTSLENQWGVDKVCDLAERHILNTGTLDDLQTNTRRILNDIILQ